MLITFIYGVEVVSKPKLPRKPSQIGDLRGPKVGPCGNADKDTDLFWTFFFCQLWERRVAGICFLHPFSCLVLFCVLFVVILLLILLFICVFSLIFLFFFFCLIKKINKRAFSFISLLLYFFCFGHCWLRLSSSFSSLFFLLFPYLRFPFFPL